MLAHHVFVVSCVCLSDFERSANYLQMDLFDWRLRGGAKMKVLVLLSNDAEVGYLISLPSEGLIKELRQLIDDSKITKAIVTAISKGIVEKLIDRNDANDIRADLILTQERACWNVVSP